MTCVACPFGDGDGWSPEAEQVINLGCVPSEPEIMAIKRDHGLNWGCHSAEEGETRLCAGFVRACREIGLDPRQGQHLSYQKWYHEGVPQ